MSKNTKLARLIICISLCYACTNWDTIPAKVLYKIDYEDARIAALEAWEDVIGPISDECYAESYEYEIMEVPRVSKVCPSIVVAPGRRLVGCLRRHTREMWIDANIFDYRKAEVAVHEYIHYLARCELSVDSLHEDPRLWEEFGEDSVETVGISYLPF
jgi:hypothetical protein